MYRSGDDARAGRDSGGTGFFVGIESKHREGTFHLVAFTNWHVAVKGGASVIRINKAGGGTDVFDFGPEDWIFIPKSYDVAALPFSPDCDHLTMTFVSPNMFATDEVIAARHIGPGDDVFMPGRFVNLGGAEANVPLLRFGNLAAMPQPVPQSNYASPPSFCVDMHSRSGFSGSPVFVYRTIGQDLVEPSLNFANTFLLLLGVHWGQFPEPWEIKKRKTEARSGRDSFSEAGGINLQGDEQYIEGLSGMTCVAPITSIVTLLDHPRIKSWLVAEELKIQASKEAIDQSERERG